MAKSNGRTARPQQTGVWRPVLDEETRGRRAVLAKLRKMSDEELFEIAVRAGIYTRDGELTPPYRDDAEPSACRPTD